MHWMYNPQCCCYFLLSTPVNALFGVGVCHNILWITDDFVIGITCEEDNCTCLLVSPSDILRGPCYFSTAGLC